MVLSLKRYRLFENIQGHDFPITVALQTIGILSSIIFLINYTFEVLFLQGLYSAQYVLIAMLHGVLSLWALVEIALVDKKKNLIPLKNLTIALCVQLAIGVIRHINDYFSVLIEHTSAIIISPDMEDGVAGIFFPLYLILFLILSKLLIDAFSYTERLRANQLQTQITLVKRADEALRASEERYRLIADRVDDLIWTLDSSGYFKYVSPSVEKLLGFGAEEVMAAPISIFVTPTSLALLETITEQVHRIVNEEILDGSQCSELEWVRKNKSTVWTEINMSALYDANDQFVGFVGVTRDITERRRQQQALMDAQAAAESANKAKTEFLNNLSHEIRTPMNAIIGLSEITLETVLLPQQKHHLKTILTSAKALLNLINDILDLAKVEAGKLTIHPDWFEPRKLVTDVIDLFRISLQAKGLQLNLEIAEDVPQYVKTDDLRLRQVLINLLGNALKFTDQGSITLRIWPIGVAPESSLSFSVRDTGIGMTSEQLEQLFQPFRQADASVSRRYGGTGLGLSISSRLIELMGGQITVESMEKKGSSFIFTIPVECKIGSGHERLPAESALAHDTKINCAESPRATIDLDSLNSSLMYLQGLLNENMFEAQQVAIDLEYKLAGSPFFKEFVPILESIQQLRYREAITCLTSFRDQLASSKEAPHA